MNDENQNDEIKAKEVRGNNNEGHKGGVPLWIWMVILILFAICIYFLSLINSKKFLLSGMNFYLLVKKGLFLPYGYSEYIPKDMIKREAYSPLKIPEGENPGTIEVDGGELDIALFRVISAWVEKYLRDENENNLKTAHVYIERLMKLNVSPEDFEKFSRLKGELVFRQAKFSFKMGLDMILNARNKLIDSKGLSPELQKERDDLLGIVQKIDNAMSPDYVLVNKNDIDKIREEIKKECISTCVKETMERNAEKSSLPDSENTPKSPGSPEPAGKPDEKKE